MSRAILDSLLRFTEHDCDEARTVFELFGAIAKAIQLQDQASLLLAIQACTALLDEARNESRRSIDPVEAARQFAFLGLQVGRREADPETPVHPEQGYRP